MRFFMVSVVFSISAVAGCNAKSDKPAESAVPATPTARHETQAQTAPGAVAVINLEVIAQRLGRLDEINASNKKKEAELNERLKVLQNTYQREFDAKKKEFGDAPTDEETKELLTLQQRYNANVAQERVRAQQELGFHQNALKKLFHEEVRPVALQAAEQRGMSAVITNNFIFAAADVVDITEDVVQRMMKQIAASKPLPESATRVSELQHGGDFLPDQK